MKVSLLIATIGRSSELQRLLDSLCVQSYTDFEVIIADQNPVGFLEPVVASYKGKLDMTVVNVIAQGVSAARNALFPYVRGEIVAFPDDDCCYVEDTLQQVVDFFKKNLHIGAILGNWKPVLADLQGQSFQSNIKPLGRYRLFLRGETYVQFYRRAVVDAVGYFDLNLGPGTGLPYGGGEDTDYLLRAAQITIVWKVYTVRVLHPVPNTVQVDKIKIRMYALGRMKLLRKHHMPLWFKLSNVIYPLWRGMVEGKVMWSYRWYMFLGRLFGLVKFN